jgi:hypothetical protein
VLDPEHDLVPLEQHVELAWRGTREVDVVLGIGEVQGEPLDPRLGQRLRRVLGLACEVGERDQCPVLTGGAGIARSYLTHERAVEQGSR